MSVEQIIIGKLAELKPQELQLLNESHMHAGPATDSHFKLVMVSDAFDGKRAVARHQMVYALLAEELKSPVHALALHLYSPQEWAANQSVPASPSCQGAH
jgi:BolA family transcriptional regulator, general stress-responsive regulator